MFDKFDIMKLNELSIESVASALGISVNRHKALCPFHDDSNPSLTFSVRKNRYRCFVCGASGGPIDLVMHYEHKSFLEACKWLSDSSGSIIDFDKFSNQFSNDFERSDHSLSKPFDASRYERFFACPFLSTEARRFLFEERRLDTRVIRWCRLTSWKDKQGVPWLQIPYYSRDGKLIGIQNRNLAYGSKFKVQGSKDDLPQPSSLNPQLELCSLARREPSSAPRFRFPAGAQCSIYNLPVLNLLKPGETLFIAEGASDCWSLLSSGHKAIAIPSATLLSRKDAKLLEGLAQEKEIRFAMYPDNDLPGEKLFLQLQKVLPTLVRYQLPAGCKDFSEFYMLNVKC